MKTRHGVIGPLFIIILLTIWLPGHPALADSGPSSVKKQNVSKAVNAELNSLLGFFDNPQASASLFSPQQIPNLLAFVAADKNGDSLHYADKFNGCPSAYYEITLPKTMYDFFRYCFNNDILHVVTGPSSVRLAHWKSITSNHKPMRKLWEYLPAPNPPLVITGIEHYVNTPDTFSGAYYDYDLDRILILFRHQERDILLSLSRQRGKSGVGKKGLILGDDDDWDYFYTAKPGLTQPGLKWVESYMYDSYSVVVYAELAPGKAPVRCGIFKWLRAGWAGFNLVRSKHIHNGLKRYEKALLKILSSPHLPSPDQLAATSNHIRSLNAEDLQRKTLSYLKELEKTYRTQLDFSNEDLAGISNIETYVDLLTVREMQSFVMLQWLKRHVVQGKTAAAPSSEDVDSALD